MARSIFTYVHRVRELAKNYLGAMLGPLYIIVMMSKMILCSCRDGRPLIFCFHQRERSVKRMCAQLDLDLLHQVHGTNFLIDKTRILSKLDQMEARHPVHRVRSPNHNLGIGGALMRLSPRKAPAAIPDTNTASLASPVGRDPRGFTRRKLFLQTTRGRRGRKVTMIGC